jgi:hypothetical protein
MLLDFVILNAVKNLVLQHLDNTFLFGAAMYKEKEIPLWRTRFFTAFRMTRRGMVPISYACTTASGR